MGLTKNNRRMYATKLRNDIRNFTINFKKRYQLFPWQKVNTLQRFKPAKQVVITIEGKSYSMKEMVKKLRQEKTSLQIYLRPSAFNYVIRDYLRESADLTGPELTKVFNKYRKQLIEIFAEQKERLQFCLQALKEINKALQQSKTTLKERSDNAMNTKKRIISPMTESTYMDSAEESLFYYLASESANDVSVYDVVNELLPECEETGIDPYTEGVNLEARKKYKESKKKMRTYIKAYKIACKQMKWGEAKTILANLKAELEAEMKSVEDLEPGGVTSMLLGNLATGLKDSIKSIMVLIPIVGIIAYEITLLTRYLKDVINIINSCHKHRGNISVHDFNIYQQRIIEGYKACIKAVDKMSKNVDKMKSASKKVIKESTEFDELDNFKFVTESGYMEDVRSIILDIYEMTDDVEGLDLEEVFSEAVLGGKKPPTKKLVSEFKGHINQTKKLLGTYKKLLKSGSEADVAKTETAILNRIEEAYDALDSIDDDLTPIMTAGFADSILNLIRTMIRIVPAIGGAGTAVQSVQGSVKVVVEVSKNCRRNAKKLTMDDCQAYKTKLMGALADTKNLIKMLRKTSAPIRKQNQEAKAKGKEKSNAPVKESAEFLQQKVSVYESCAKGEITVEEREEMLESLNQRAAYMEATRDIDSDDETKSNYEKFEDVRDVLYERCSNGEITIEEREDLIAIAKEKLNLL